MHVYIKGNINNFAYQFRFETRVNYIAEVIRGHETAAMCVHCSRVNDCLCNLEVATRVCLLNSSSLTFHVQLTRSSNEAASDLWDNRRSVKPLRAGCDAHLQYIPVALR